MKCHRTIGPHVYGLDWDIASESRDCIGSECSLWVPAVKLPGSTVEIPRFGMYDKYEDGDLVPYDSGKKFETGRGWCKKNLRREPIQDPAATTKQED